MIIIPEFRYNCPPANQLKQQGSRLVVAWLTWTPIPASAWGVFARLDTRSFLSFEPLRAVWLKRRKKPDSPVGHISVRISRTKGVLLRRACQAIPEVVRSPNARGMVCGIIFVLFVLVPQHSMRSRSPCGMCRLFRIDFAPGPARSDPMMLRPISAW
jgi:hypothetical protein